MPWNTGGNDPTPGPWGSPGDGNKRPRNEGSKDRGPWGGGGKRPSGSGPGNNMPDLDQLIARANAAFRGILPNGGGNGGRPALPGLPFSGGRGMVLLVLLFVAIWLATGFYRVQPDEQGVVLRFGAFNRTTLPGLNYHIPWPVEAALTPSVTHINRVEVGFSPAVDTPVLRMTSRGLVNDAGSREQSKPAESLMLTGDENIIDIDFAVFWRVRDAGNYLFSARHPDDTVKQVAESEMREVIGRTPIQPALTEARAQIETDVRAGMQAILDQYKTGVEITQVQLQKVDPPADVIESFRDVQRANTDAERMRNEAESYRNDIVPRARGDAAAVTATAEGARQAAIAEAGGQAQRFESVYAAYQAAKDVTLRRLYIETMQAIISRTPTTVLDAGIKTPIPLLNLGDAQPAQASPPTAPAAAATTAGTNQ
ncbi:FtsH protease activity modulator HflK [Acidisphaera sp. L21]|uniref:FtsH protease activity modulator HflK n=1 Tax=Acidisphaera sp. L21 TaxID=1641851 RepID=UPI00131CA641|nr:FtsH protease activity modulator HflK [Acidisphaera sp. L21]